MALLLLPFFMPLFLVGWVLTPREEREHRLLQSRRELQFGRSWGLLYGRESEVLTREELEELAAGALTRAPGRSA
ncbi:hypothetical protein ENSA5_07210 [Enhygromyxa salina]|uniref:Uncharacterized protein n=1 Tax=Enhygromyxa salina TaxID=215803 RepID=A0A2S9YHA9_9BACT|nr:hypothetical protein [Enhygromyxa salina]PRQ04490.1 hypothetical protein ENSA5_07210 [Enhygromyxa salina]